jgi:histidine racemase
MRIEKIKRVAIVYPSGNTTAIIFDQLSSNNLKQLNARIIEAWQQQNPDQPHVEQCCFVTLPRSSEAMARVEMFGGEFCGNAARSAIWMLTKGQNYRGKIEVSGVERPLTFSVNDGEVKVEMPLLKDKSLVQRTVEGSLVRHEGIRQLVVIEQGNDQTPRKLLTNLLKCNKYDLCSQPAVGVSYYNKQSGEAKFCVWVKEVDTIFDETACGSGTSAIGMALAVEFERPMRAKVIQPSGEIIRTEADYNGGKVRSSYIVGRVDVLYDGEYKLS